MKKEMSCHPQGEWLRGGPWITDSQNWKEREELQNPRLRKGVFITASPTNGHAACARILPVTRGPCICPSGSPLPFFTLREPPRCSPESPPAPTLSDPGILKPFGAPHPENLPLNDVTAVMARGVGGALHESLFSQQRPSCI